MDVAITRELSPEIYQRFSDNTIPKEWLKAYFEKRIYGEHVKELIIGITCMSPRFDSFFKPRRPRYRTEEKTYVAHGIQITTPAMYLDYELRLDFEQYLNTKEFKALFAQDIVASLDTISKIKKIKDFDLPRFKADFEQFFRENGWL